MKKENIILFLSLGLALILNLNMMLAIDFSLSKNSYYSRETLQLEISGNFIDSPKTENIGIYSGGSNHKTPAESGILKDSNTKYFYYAILPETPGEYSLRIENTKYYDSSQKETEEPFEINFTITSTNNSYLSFNPGAILASSDFSIKIIAYNKEETINVEFSPSNFKENFSLGYGEEKIVIIPITGIKNLTKSKLKINNYEAKVIVSPESENEINETIELRDLIELSDEEIKENLLANEDYFFTIVILNKENEEIRGINVSTSNKDIELEEAIIENISESYKLNFIINSEDSFNSTIKLSYKNSSVSIPIIIIITKNESQVNYTNDYIGQEIKTCEQMGGKICNYDSGELCQGSKTISKEGYSCCLGQCYKESSGTGWIWGIVIIVVLAVAGFFIYKKYKKNPGEERTNQILKRRTDDFKERMNPSPGEEVRKGLSKT